MIHFNQKRFEQLKEELKDNIDFESWENFVEFDNLCNARILFLFDFKGAELKGTELKGAELK